MENRLERIAVILLMVAGLGCEPPHASHQDVASIAAAVVRADSATVVANHIESSTQSTYCQTDSFKDVLKEASTLKGAGVCEKLAPEPKPEMKDVARLLWQVVGYVCQSDAPTCDGYAKAVLAKTLQNNQLFRTELASFEVVKLIGDDSSAAAYIDFKGRDGKSHPRTLRFVKVGSSWHVKDGFGT